MEHNTSKRKLKNTYHASNLKVLNHGGSTDEGWWRLQTTQPTSGGEDINEKLQDYLNQSVNYYLRENSMNSYGTWATDSEMMATAILLGIDIVVHSKIADCMDWLRYPASFSNERTSDFAIYLENISEHLNLVISVQQSLLSTRMTTWVSV